VATARLLLPLLLATAALTLSQSLAAAEPKRPNVLFLISDDLNHFLGCYGDPRAKTPNIDRLAARGVMFERAYCQFPLCGPSRNSMLTGLYPDSTGILRNAEIFRQTIPSQVSLPQAFRQHGYFAARIGKLFHYSVPTSVGTNGHDDPGSWELELNPLGVDRLEEEPQIFSLTPGQFGGTLSWYASPKNDADHTDGLMAADAEWVLERCARDRHRPFFLAVGFFRPHTPYVAPRPYFDHYPRAEMPLVTGIEEDQADIPPAGLGSYKPEQDKLTDDLRRECIQAYYASISFMDAQVGRVIDALDRLGLADETIIVFTSDHSYHMGEHGLWQKMSLFEESARVPLLIVAPGVASPGSSVTSPVGLIDLYPTLAELCEIEPPQNLQGQSLVPMLRDSSVAGRGWALTQVTRGGRTRRGPGVAQGRQGPPFFGYSLRTPRWRYTEWDEGHEGRELYDHDRDPRELTNLADDPAYADTVADLSAQLRHAIQSALPSSGRPEPPNVRVWNPNLTDP
jgi:arylsulfatase A-like enzyme